MADNLYDQLNRYSLSDVGRGLGGFFKGMRSKLTAEQLRALTAPGLGRGAQAAAQGMVAPTDAQLRAEGFGFGVREYDPLERGIKPPGYIQYGTRDGVTPDQIGRAHV